MINEKFIMLVEKYLDNELTAAEENELNRMIEADPVLKEEFFEQKKVKDALSKMMMKNPGREVWDSYWTKMFNKAERSFGWILLVIGAIILGGFAIYDLVGRFIINKSIPSFVKIAITLVALGFIILLISIIREKITTSLKDKYREIQR